MFDKIVSRKALIEEISCAGNIIDVYERFKDEPFCNLLLNGTNQDFVRYSYFGCSPFLIIKTKNNNINLELNGKKHSFKSNPFYILKKIAQTYRLIGAPGKFNLLAGGIGYLSYDLCHFTEKLPRKCVDDLKLPDCYFAFYRLICIHDSRTGKMWAASVDFLEPNAKKAAASARFEIKRFKNKLMEPHGFKTVLPIFTSFGSTPRCLAIHPQVHPHGFQKIGEKTPFNINLAETQKGAVAVIKAKSNFSKQDFLKAIRRVKAYIIEGDIYQVNLSQRFRAAFKGDAFCLFKSLSIINPAPFSCFMNFNNFTIVGSSPERFLKVKNCIVQTRPMKGTRPRGNNRKENNALSKELLASKKDDAELSMIVDLERNDIGKVCEFGSVKVSEHKNLETYSTVFQLTSTVTGKMNAACDCIDLLRACFPGGSITGCPKIRAMEIIDELEPSARSVYTGSMGYIGFNGTMDFNIAIRTIILKHGEAFFQVGSGIVADSDPLEEYNETLDKAKAMFLALGK